GKAPVRIARPNSGFYGSATGFRPGVVEETDRHAADSTSADSPASSFFSPRRVDLPRCWCDAWRTDVMASHNTRPVDRRLFLKGAAAGAAALVAKAAPVAPVAPVEAQEPSTPRSTPSVPASAQLAADTEAPPRPASPRITEHPASDFMVDVIKTLGFEYAAANPGSSFEGLHESIINYGSNTMPELLTCCHEESSVAMAHGYAKIEGKPMLAIVHGNIGLQHASMAIYNAYADRVPVFVMAGNWRDAGNRANGVNSYHSAQDMALIVRDSVKWDDEPGSLAAFA